MPTSAPPPPLEAPGPPWRALALLTAIVVGVHLALLGLTPASVGSPPSPRVDKFLTRTLVIAPPAAEPKPPPAPAASAAAKPSPHPARPRPTPKPRPAAPAPVPNAATTAQSEPASRDLVAESSAETGPSEAPPAPTGGSGPSAADGQGTADSAAAGNMPGSVPLHIAGSVRLSFAATGQRGASPMQGVFGELAWLQDGSHYDAQLSLTFLFKTIRSNTSTGVIGPTGIEPLRFSDKRRTEVASHFVRDQKTIIFSNNSPSQPLLAGAQDRLSVVLQLGALMAGDPARYPADSVIAVQTVGPSDAEIWTFHVSGEEQVTVPAGEFTARRLTRNPRKPFDDKVELWLAPELGYLPVRLKFTESSGDFADLQLREKLPPRPAN